MAYASNPSAVLKGTIARAAPYAEVMASSGPREPQARAWSDSPAQPRGLAEHPRALRSREAGDQRPRLLRRGARRGQSQGGDTARPASERGRASGGRKRVTSLRGGPMG